MSYQDTSYYRRPHSLERGYAADYYDENPVDGDYPAKRDYGARRPRRQREELRRRPSSVGGDNSDHLDRRYQRDQYRPYEGSYSQQRKRDSSPESSRSYRHRNRHKSMDGGSRDGRDDKSYSSDGDRDNSNHDRGWADGLLSKGGKLLAQAAVPLIAAGAAEALRSRNEPGEWKGDKGKHVMKSAVTNGLMNKDPSTPHRHHVVDTTMSGLKDGRPSREEMAEIRRRAATNHTLDNLKKVAAAGALVFAGKEIYDRYERSKSQKRGQDYDKDYDDNRHSSNRGNRSDSEDSNSEMWSRDLDERAYRRPRSKYRDDRSDHWENYSGRNHG